MKEKQKVSVALSSETLRILDKGVKQKIFANRSHGVERCVHSWDMSRKELLEHIADELTFQRKYKWPPAPLDKTLPPTDLMFMLEEGIEKKYFKAKDIVKALGEFKEKYERGK